MQHAVVDSTQFELALGAKLPADGKAAAAAVRAAGADAAAALAMSRAAAQAVHNDAQRAVACGTAGAMDVAATAAGMRGLRFATAFCAGVAAGRRAATHRRHLSADSRDTVSKRSSPRAARGGAAAAGGRVRRRYSRR